jgi:DNA-binding NarL/FixJ family response regulator
VLEGGGFRVAPVASADEALELLANAPEAEVRLTPRLWEVLELLMAGKSNRDTAQELNLSENTIKVHLAALFRALGVTSRTEAVLARLARPELKRS